MVNNFRGKISNCSSTSSLLAIANKHYRFYKPNQVAVILKSFIKYRQLHSSDIPLKLICNLSFYIISSTFYPINLKNVSFKRDSKDFELLCRKAKEIIIKQQVFDSVNPETTLTYFGYHLNYSNICVGQYLQLFNAMDELSKEIYGFSCYDLCKCLLPFFDISLQGSLLLVPKEKFVQSLTRYGLSLKIIDKVFENRKSLLSTLYITDIPQKMIGRIGIKNRNYLYIPNAFFILCNFLNGILTNEKSNNIKGKLFEKIVIPLLRIRFTNATIYHNYYVLKNNKLCEQDILLEYNNTLLIVECKAQNFKGVLGNPTKAQERLDNNFRSVLKKACIQCERANSFFKENGYIILSDKKTTKSLKKGLQTYKIVITLDDYLNLEQNPNKIFNLNKKYQNTWIVNLSDFQKILLINPKVDQLLNYIKFRSEDDSNISSASLSELDIYGAYFSELHHYVRKAAESNGYVRFFAKNSFSQIFDKIDCQLNDEEISKLYSHANNIVK
ncbi:hypothetical protein [Limosilactobacillus oris]|uniref:hypothetical protein n=1 Tax=Limosilactobacillus oris TaxID=1632 RepID=UPI0022363E68|nr:hypothetical protein [Limosilactobacillus oris]MCW4388105.1 hypothetical protein [Limosilactobacillus oris]